MSPGRWLQVKTIFHGAAERSPAERLEFLRESCGSVLDLRKEVESLLSSEEETGSLLDHPVMAEGAMAAAAPVRALTSSPDPLMDRAIGNYVITGEIARGGMGIVYRARHVSLPRDVVVKCIRPARNGKIHARRLGTPAQLAL